MKSLMALSTIALAKVGTTWRTVSGLSSSQDFSQPRTAVTLVQNWFEELKK